ncbi:MAG: hypothetical protein V2I97_19150 [Desulfococcaceae bacterium]|jgi:hypothetical protein|nr:hypothetical protein [Desulfococcaceae bacterium]
MNTGILTKFHYLDMLYRSGWQSDIAEQTLNKLFALEKENVTCELAKLNARLENFETRYNMPSDVFYQRYENGELDDCAEFMEWSSFYDMRQTAQQHFECLAGGLQ